MTPATTTEARIRITDVKGIRRAELMLKPGVNLLEGRNGAGKSSAMAAAQRLLGGDIPLEPRDGAGMGTVEGLGVALQVRKVVRATGIAELALAYTSPVSDLIDPGIKDSTKANEARIRAVLRLVKPPVTDEAIATLADDPEVAAIVQRECSDLSIQDLFAAAEKVRLTTHRLKRDQEGLALEARGNAGASELEARRALDEASGTLTSTSPSEAEARETKLRSLHATAQVTCRQREEHEDRQAQVRATLGERPDTQRSTEAVATAEARVAELDRQKADLERQIKDLERSLRDASSSLAEAKADLKAARDRKEADGRALVTWDKQAAILDEPSTGATLDEVRRLADQLKSAQEETVRARCSDRHRKAKERAAIEAAKADERTKRAEALEILATTVGDRLGKLLSGTAADGLTVVNGRLCVLEDGECFDFELRRSDGQRIRAAFGMALRAYRHGVVPLDGRHWTALDHAAKAELAGIARDMGVMVLTEEATSGDLILTHLPAADALDSERGAA